MAENSLPKKRSYHHGDARTALIDVATQLLITKGAAKLSMREAARLVGIDPAACYRHFRDKNALLIAIAQIGFLQLSNKMLTDAPKTLEAESRVIALGHAYIDFAINQPEHFRLMFGGSGLPSLSPKLRSPDIKQTAYEQLEGCLQDWASQRNAVPDISQLALMIWANVHGISRLMVDGAIQLGPSELHALTEQSIKACLDSYYT